MCTVFYTVYQSFTERTLVFMLCVFYVSQCFVAFFGFYNVLRACVCMIYGVLLCLTVFYAVYQSLSGADTGLLC